MGILICTRHIGFQILIRFGRGRGGCTEKHPGQTLVHVSQALA